MQLESNHIYKNVADNNQLDLELVKSVGDIVFQSFSMLQRDPPNLVLNLKGIGQRFVRRKKVHDWIDRLIRIREGIIAGRHFRREVKEIDDELIHLRTILDWYDEFTEKRKYIKTLRNDYPPSMESTVPSIPIQDSCNGYQGEHQGISPGESPVPTFKDWISPT